MGKSLGDNKDERDGYSNDVVARKGRQMLVSSLLFNVGVGNGAGRREDRSGKMNRRDSRYGFETRSLTARSVATATLTFYVVDPSALFTRLRAGYGAAGEITSNDQTSCLMVRDSWFRPGV